MDRYIMYGSLLPHQIVCLNLVWLWCDLLFKPLEHFVVFSLMHGHLLQVCFCQCCRDNRVRTEAF